MASFKQILPAPTNIVPAIFNWDETESTVENIDPELEFDFDPLAFVLSALDQKNLFKSDVHTLLEFKKEELDTVLLDRRQMILDQIKNYESLSNEIQRHYRNKILLRRLKDYHFTDFLKSLDEILENPKKIKRSQLRILLKLNDFYKEDCATDELFKNYKTISGDLRNHNLDDEFAFVKIIERFSKRANKNRYYFTNKDRNLLLIESDRGTTEDRLMDYVSRQSSIVVRGSCDIRHQSHREDFLLYRNGDFRFYDPNSKTTG